MSAQAWMIVVLLAAFLWLAVLWFYREDRW